MRLLPLMLRYGVPALIELVRDQVVEYTSQIGKLQARGRGTFVHRRASLQHAHNIALGERVSVGTDVRLWASPNARIRVGSHVMFGPGCCVITANHGTRDLSTTMNKAAEEEADVTIAEGAWLGANVVVLPGVTIGEGAVVAASAVVTRDVAPYTIVAGIPARPIGSRRAA